MKVSELIKELQKNIDEYGDRDVMLENRSDSGGDSFTKSVFISGGYDSVCGLHSDEICFFIEADYSK